MIDHLIEIVFEDVSKDRIGELLRDLTSKGEEVQNYSFTHSISEVNWGSKQSIEDVFSQPKNFGAFINLKKLERTDFCIMKCGIAIYKYEDKINLEINFQLTDLDCSDFKKLTKELMNLAHSIAVQCDVEEYYCGLEPAEEKETRLFTKQHVGQFNFIQE